MNVIYSTLVPFLGAAIGIGIGIIIQPVMKKWLSLLLSFSGAFLLGIIIFHLMPFVFAAPHFKAGIWIAGGLLLQILLEYLSEGAEHGHIHRSEKSQAFPYILWGSLCLHAFIEGTPLTSNHTLLIGIFVHKIPIATILVFMVYHSKASTFVKFSSLFIFCLMTPLGSMASLYANPLPEFELISLAVVIGILLHIATTILFESNQNHTFNFKKILSIVIALLAAYYLR